MDRYTLYIRLWWIWLMLLALTAVYGSIQIL
jgi:hypothetical protein